MKVTICGDVHARFGWINTILNKTKPDLFICLGEFGYWPDQHWMYMKTIQTNICPIWWIDGNHESFYHLNRRISNEILPNIFYKPRGSVENINGKNCAFLGGGFSIDYQYRVIGHDYFPDDEILKQSEINKIPDDIKLDIVFSHTAPQKFVIINKNRDKEFSDQSRYRLDEVLMRYQPKEWYFAHWHKYKRGYYKHKNGKTTNWVCLNKIDDLSGYKTIEI